jgi:hypothetical protein
MEYREFTDEERKWIKSFKRVMKKAPDSLFMFVGSGAVVIYTKDEHGRRYMNSYGSVDGDAPDVQILTDMECDGGDW